MKKMIINLGLVVSTLLTGLTIFNKPIEASSLVQANIVATGDDTNIMLYVGILAVCVIVIAGLIFFNRKSKKNDDDKED